MNTAYLNNPANTSKNANSFSDFTFFQKLDALAGGKQLEDISKEQEANIIASTNKTNAELTKALTTAQQSLSDTTVKPLKIQLYIALGIITILFFVIIYLKKKNQ